MDPSLRLKELFQKYLERDIKPAEVEELVLLLGRADAEEALSGPMLALWEELKTRPVEHPVDWARMYRQVSQVEEDLSTLNRRRGGVLGRRGGVLGGKGGLLRGSGGVFRRMGWHRLGWVAVAGLFLCMAATAAYWSVNIGTTRKSMMGMAAADKTAAGPVTASRSGAGPGSGAGSHGEATEKKKVMHLPDGSTVLLNKHSTLEYTATGPGTGTGAGTGAREVTLSGEAYFDIARRPNQPFLVHTGKLVTRVLGTAFNVKAYPGEDSIEVTVDHGKVQVLKGRTSMAMLTDNQQILYHKGTEGYTAQRVNVRPVIAWKPAEISFDDITMEEAARQIGQRFNVVVSFANPVVKNCRVTATFYQEDELDEIMTVICGVSQSGFVINGNKIVIDGKGCN
jgi:ferric-dicitrate binding protein FerR (iron transport regulator)